MKTKSVILSILFMFFFLVSCGGPDALVINTIHRDGSLTRRVILTYDKDEFDLDNCQVPIDSTWAIEKNLEISEEGDSTWTLLAEREYFSVEELNNDYINYGGPNARMKRQAVFEKKFNWFNTIFRFSENVDKAFDGIPPDEYFGPEELNLFYMPGDMKEEINEGDDSTLIKNLEERYDQWLSGSFTRAFILELSEFAKNSGDTTIDLGYLSSKAASITGVIFEEDMDEYETIQQVLGEGYYEAHSVAIDTSISLVEDKFEIAFDADNYLLQTMMPGELISTNGYIDSDNNILWKVDGDCFLSSDYEMWAESKITNIWAWITTGLFLLFVAAGFISRIKRKKE